MELNPVKVYSKLCMEPLEMTVYLGQHCKAMSITL